jgi:hypothetical protein
MRKEDSLPSTARALIAVARQFAAQPARKSRRSSSKQ